MANLHRGVALLVLLLQVSGAFAATCTEYQAAYLSWSGGWNFSKPATCTNLATALDGAAPARNHTGVHDDAVDRCRIHYTTIATGGYNPNWAVVSYASRIVTCPQGEGCPTGEAMLKAAQTSVVEGISQNAAKAAASYAAQGKWAECQGGCVVKRTEAACGGTSGGSWRCEFYKGGATNKECSATGKVGYWDGTSPFDPGPLEAGPSGTPTSSVTDKPPGPGMCPGEVNGVTVYKPCDSTGSVTTTASTSAAGSATVTTTSDSGTVCANGTCTTVTTKTVTTTVNGVTSTQTTTSAGSTTTVQSQDEYCKKNPNDSQCVGRGESAFSGSCSSSFTCSGDAALCAVAQATQQQLCALTKTSAESARYDSEKNKEGDQTGGLPGNRTVTFGVGNYDTANILSAPSCVADLQIDLFGKPVALPISKVCPWLATLKTILMLIGSVMWMVIVFRG